MGFFLISGEVSRDTMCEPRFSQQHSVWLLRGNGDSSSCLVALAMFTMTKGAGIQLHRRPLDFTGLLQISIARAEQTLAQKPILWHCYKIQMLFVPGIWDNRAYVSWERATRGMSNETGISVPCWQLLYVHDRGIPSLRYGVDRHVY